MYCKISDVERNTLRLAMVKVKFELFWIGFMGVGPTPTNSETSKKAVGRIFVGQNDLVFKIKT